MTPNIRQTHRLTFRYLFTGISCKSVALGSAVSWNNLVCQQLRVSGQNELGSVHHGDFSALTASHKDVTLCFWRARRTLLPQIVRLYGKINQRGERGGWKRGLTIDRFPFRIAVSWRRGMLMEKKAKRRSGWWLKKEHGAGEEVDSGALWVKSVVCTRVAKNTGRGSGRM